MYEINRTSTKRQDRLFYPIRQALDNHPRVPGFYASPIADSVADHDNHHRQVTHTLNDYSTDLLLPKSAREELKAGYLLRYKTKISIVYRLQKTRILK